MAKQRLFFSSDLHFGHGNSIKFCNRPFKNVDDMNKGLIDNWNNVVGEKDIVWTLGDFAFMSIDEIIKILGQLNGEHHMILGNHCKQVKNHAKRLIDLGLVNEIRDYKEISWPGSDGNKQKICLFHYPQRSWNGSHYGSWQLHGHVHGTMEPYGRSVDVGVDAPWVTGYAPYRPISFEEIELFMSKQPVVKDFDD